MNRQLLLGQRMQSVRLALHLLPLALILLIYGSFTSLHAQERIVRGVVTDFENGQGLPGATVFLLGTTIGTTTNIQGNYSIRIPAKYSILQFSFIGFKTQKVDVGDKLDLNIKLQRDALQLDETLVVGYGTLPRREITSSVSRISRDDMGDFAPRTADQVLQGRIPGVQFTSASGILGAPSNIRIRGASSISASTTPLFVIDGVPVTNPTTAGSASVGQLLGGEGINPLININANDIESYEVLKDASASAIYGSRGSNGVVLITTRKGRADQQIVNFRTSFGTMSSTKVYDMMNGDQFTQIWNDAAVNRYGASGGGLLLPTPNAVNTNWLDLVKRTGGINETSVSVAGGTQRTQYYIGGTYHSDEGFVQNNLLKRYSGRARLDHALSDEVKVGINISPSRTDDYRVSTSNNVAAPFTYALLYYPNVAPRKADGSLNLTVTPNVNTQFPGTPLSNVEGVDIKSSLTQLLSSATIEWHIMKNLQFNTDLSVDLFQLTEKQKRATFTTDGFPDGNAFSSNNQYVNYNLNTTLQYTDQYEAHKYTILAGSSMQRSENTAFSASDHAFPSDLLKNISSGAAANPSSGTGTSFSFLGYFARANYSYMDRYLLTLTGRVDGSSRFGADHRYGFFPSASAGWIISDEDFFKTVPVIDFLKLRGSLGVTGNAEIGDFPSLGLTGFGANYNDLPGASITQLANPDLRWEKTNQYEGAVEFGILGNTLRGSIGYYTKNTTDLLLNVPVSRVNGFSTILQNIGEVQNSGIEFELSADILHGGDFRWSVSANVSTIKNKVTKLVRVNGVAQDLVSGRNIVREGEALGSWYLVRYNGVNSTNGNASFLDLNGNPTDTYSTANRVIAGSPFPDYFGGITSSFSYGAFDATIFFQFTKGNMIYRADGGFTDTNLGSIFNQSIRQLDYWSPTNTGAANPQPRLLISNGSQASTRYLEDGSYLRLKQATIGYTLPSFIVGDMRARLYAQGQNLFTSTKFLGMDPEGASTGNIQAFDVFFQLPQARTIMIGLDLTF